MTRRYRTNLRMVYLSDEENAILIRNMQELGSKTFSAYARKVLLNPGITMVHIDTSNYDELLGSLKRIGNNINQITHLAHQNQELSQTQVRLLEQDFLEMIREVRKDFEIKKKEVEKFYGSDQAFCHS